MGSDKMKRIRCKICGKPIRRDSKKDYGVYTHYYNYKEMGIKRKYFCGDCSFRLERYFKFLEKKQGEEYLKKHPEGKYFVFLGESWDTGQKYFMLKKKLEKEAWGKIADLFFFCGYSAEDDGLDPPDSARGHWITHDPQKVMERLDWE